HVGQLDREARRALAHVDVEVVERCRADLDHDLAGPGLWLAELLDPEHVDPAELVEDDSLHAAAFMSDFRSRVKQASSPRSRLALESLQARDLSRPAAKPRRNAQAHRRRTGSALFSLTRVNLGSRPTPCSASAYRPPTDACVTPV